MVPPPTRNDLAAYFDRLAELLHQEEEADHARTALLATRCSFDELEKRGLAVNGLSVSGVSLGLGGKSLVSLARSSAFHNDTKLPSHGFRNGDPAKIVPQSAVRKTAGKSKSAAAEDEKEVEGVVYKVSDSSITLAVPEPKDGEEHEFPERCRLIKTANSGTFDRMEKAIERVRRVLQVSAATSSSTSRSSADLADGSVKRPAMNDAVAKKEEAPAASGQDAPTAEAPPIGSEVGNACQPEAAPSDPEALSQDALAAASLDDAPEPQRASNHPSLKLLQALYGVIPASFSSEFETTKNINWFDETLNDSQKEAVRFVLSMNEVGCIHGPPGTGKTHTLVEVIRQLVSVQKKRVLVCGASNLSVDNLLLRLAPLFPPTSVTRIGHPARVLPGLLQSTLDYQTAHSSAGAVVRDVKKELEGHLNTLAKGRKEKGAVKGKKRGETYGEVRELRKEVKKREGKVVEDVLSSTRIVLATCHTAGSRQLFWEDFDVVIIDEATQALEAVCLIPVLKAKKLILAGDPCQLGPTIISSKPSSTPKEKQARQGKRTAESKAIEKADDGRSKASTLGGHAAVTFNADDPASDAEDTAATSLAPDVELPKSMDQETGPPSDEKDFLPPLHPLRPPRSLDRTLFARLERLYGPPIKRILTVQYRMNTSIASFPSDALYASLLRSAPSVAARRLADLPGVDNSEEAAEFLEPPVVFIDTAGCEFYERTDEGGVEGDGSKRNENEAELVRKYVEKLVSFQVSPQDIAVLAAYQAQVAHLSTLLKLEYPDLLIGTVDSLQGQEREAVVLSLVRSNAQREVGFLSEERRLNVAMTRAKRQLCVVGDSGTVANGSPYLKRWMAWLEEHAEVRFAMDD